MSQQKIDGFLKYLKPSKDIQNQFFQKKKDQQSFDCDVQKNGNKVIPYRNPKCISLECVYSQDVLVEKFTREAELNGNYKFTCQYCNTPIYLNAFVLDTNLQKIVDDAYQKNPQSNKRITVNKNGSWNPVVDKTKNQLSMVNLPEVENQDTIVPDIQDFTIEDYNILLEKYKNEWPAEFSETAFKSYDMEVKFADVYSLIFKSEVSIDTMRFLMAYLQNQNLKDQYKWKIFYIGVDLQEFDETKNEGKYEYINGYEQTLGSNEFNNWEYIALFFRFERVWTLLIYKQRDKQVVAMNFYHLQQTTQISKYLLSTILNIKSEPKFIPAFEIDKVEDLQYSGNLIFLFFYNLLVEKDFSHMTDVTKEGVQSFKAETASLKWLILKSTERYIEKNNLQRPKSLKSIQSQPLIQKEPSYIKTPSIQREPSLKKQSTVQSQKPSTQLFFQEPIKTHSTIPPYREPTPQTIKNPSNQEYIPSLTYINQQPAQIQRQPTIQPQRKYSEPKEIIRYVPIQKNKGDDDVVQLSRDELVQLLEKVRSNVLYEIKNPQKDLARQYVEEIDKFNVKIDKLDHQQPQSLRNQSILLTGQEMYNILDKFKNDVEHRVGEDRKHGINYIDPQIEKEEAEKNFQSFQSILWYYYQYYPEMQFV